MTEQEFEERFDRGEFDNEYSDYLCDRLPVGNGHRLVRLMEDSVYYEDFKEHMLWGNR